MPRILESRVGDREIYVGPYGGRYVLDEKGQKIYITKGHKRSTVFRPRRGAYKRFLESQVDLS